MAYATREELYRYGASQTMLANVVRDDQEAMLQAASDRADELIRGQVAVPVQRTGTAYPVGLVQAVCQIAAYELLTVRGFSDEAFEANMRKRAEAAIDRLKAIGRDEAHPGWADASVDGAAGYDGPFVLGPDGEAPSPRGL